jgi:hypothetical protein
MRIQYLSPLSDLKAELKPLFSNEYMLAFLKTFVTQSNLKCGGGKRQKTRDMTLKTFLESSFILKWPEGL